jgi:hypothetical protein
MGNSNEDWFGFDMEKELKWRRENNMFDIPNFDE